MRNQQLLQLLEEEKLSKIELRSQYEKQLNLLRKSTEQSCLSERRKVLQEFDYVIRKYHGLAVEAAKLARSEHEKLKTEKERVQRVAESACKVFEKEIKDRTRRALDEYRRLAQEAHAAARQERTELLRHCSKMESAIDKERRAFEAHVVREAERRVAGYRSALDEAQAETKKEKEGAQRRMDKLCDSVEQRCLEFERTLRSKALQVLWQHGVDMEEIELIKLLDSVPGAPLRSTVPEKAAARVKQQGQLPPQRPDAEFQVQPIPPPQQQQQTRYGFIPKVDDAAQNG